MACHSQLFLKCPQFGGLCEIMEIHKTVAGKRVAETVSQVLCVVCVCVRALDVHLVSIASWVE